MSKRIIALLLCAFMLIPCFAGCSSEEDTDLGAYITMYLTDQIFDFDPANAYYNTDALNVIGMMYDTLFKLDDNGKVKNSLAKEYKLAVNAETGEKYMEITLNDAYWSNNIKLSAEDVVFAWKRLLKSSNDFAAASLLFDIKNARAVKEGDISIDDLGVEAVEIDVVRITFEGEVDINQFLLNLTSLATAPLYENYVSKNPDWAKKPSTMVTSGPFKLGKINYKEITDESGNPVKVKDDNAIDANGNLKTETSYEIREINYFYLERNVYYYRDTERDPIDESVTPYRILVDCTMDADEILKAYKDGKIFYMGSIPMSLRNDAFVQENVKRTDALSTFVLYMNEKALINDGGEGEALFANADVRNALSLAIDREAIAKEVVYAKAATGLVSPGVFNGNKYSSKNDFRTAGGELIKTTADKAAAEALLSKAGITASKYSFTIKVAAYDDVHVAIVDKIAEAWSGLGFNVTVEEMNAIVNNDYYKEVGTEPSDVCDDLFIEALQRNKYEVIAFDYNAYSADAYSVLSNFALSFSGMALDMTDSNYSQTPNSTGYVSEEYNNLIEAIFYLPYFAKLPSTEEELKYVKTADLFPGIFDSVEEYLEVYNKVKAVYDANGITPSTKTDDWADQKATLLHKAEELLLTDMPVIPVIFNENAVLVHDDLSKTDGTFYIPAHFQKTKLKDYEKYSYLDKKGESISIFAEFPSIEWDKASK